MINQNSEILNKLFLIELQTLIERYNKIDEETKHTIEKVIATLEDQELKSYLINNPNKLIEVVEEIKCKDINKDIITFFVWHNLEIGNINIDKAKEYMNELQISKYVEIDEYIIYNKDNELKEYAREILEDRLEQEYYVDKLFEKETIIEMWINGITKKEMIDEIVDNNDLEETLELYPQYAFTINEVEYKYSKIEL